MLEKKELSRTKLTTVEIFDQPTQGKIFDEVVHVPKDLNEFIATKIAKDQWKEVSNKWYYYINGVMQTGWQTIEGNVYYFNTQGVMQTGWFEEWGAKYYFNTNGMQATGWQTIKGNVYCFNTQGVMQTGWFKEWGATYYFNTNGMQATGWQTIKGNVYYFNTQGVMQTGWFKEWDATYYFNTNGMQAIGWQTINGNVYYFNTQGVMQTGWFEEWGATYYFNTNGAQATGWLEFNNYWYYFNTQGVMQTSWQTIDGNVYYFNTQGIMQTGWFEEWGATYYFNTNGKQATGWLEFNNYWYYFSNSGVMQTGWLELKNIWYYFESNGIMATNTIINGWNINSTGVSNKPASSTNSSNNSTGGPISIGGCENILISKEPGSLCPNGNDYTTNMVNFVKMYESLHLTVYVGTDNQNQTIGWGHAVPAGTYPTGYTITLSEAETLLTEDLNFAANCVKQAANNFGVHLNQNQFDALVSFAFNAGGSLTPTTPRAPLQPYPWLQHSALHYLASNGTEPITYLVTSFVEFSNCNGSLLEGLYDRNFAQFWMFHFGVYNVLKDCPISTIQSQYPQFF